MSKLTLENIDRWLFEFEEGNLSAHQELELHAFLEKNPAFLADKKAWNNTKIDGNALSYSGNSLKKPFPIFYTSTFILLLFGIVYGIYHFTNLEAEKYFVSELDLDAGNTLINEAEQIVFMSDLQPENKFLIINSKTKILTVKDKKRLKQDKKEANLTRVFVAGKNPLSIKKIEEKDLTDNDVVETLNLKTKLTSLKSDDKKDELDLKIKNIAELDKSVVSKHLSAIVAAISRKENNSDLAIVKPNKRAAFNKSKINKKLKASLRKLKNMMDNPIALRNFRDPVYHAPFSSGFELNPAMVGTQVAPKFQVVGRGRWIGEANEKYSTRISYDAYAYQLRGGIGVDATHNYFKKGVVQSYEVGLTYSPKLTMAKIISVEPALRFKMGNKSLDANKLNFGSQIEENRGEVENVYAEGETPSGAALWYRDLNVGLLINTPWFYIGGGVDNVLKHYNNIYANNIAGVASAQQRYTAQVGTDYSAQNRDLKLSTYLLYAQRGNWKECWLGASLRLNNYNVGLGVSSLLEPALNLGLDTERLRLMYNGDYTKSWMDNRSYLSHQISIRFKLKPNRYAIKLLNI